MLHLLLNVDEFCGWMILNCKFNGMLHIGFYLAFFIEIDAAKHTMGIIHYESRMRDISFKGTDVDSIA